MSIDDLVLLEQLNESRVVSALKDRYTNDKIYTNIGPVLVAVNPFKMIRSLYTEATIREYKGRAYFEAQPHIYSLADSAYTQMKNYSNNQCVIITGESGSGKTGLLLWQL